MKNVFLVTLLLCLGLYSHAQQYFYKRYPLGGIGTVMTGIVQINNKYYGTAVTTDSLHPSIYAGVKFFVLDAAGNRVRDTFYYASHGIAYIWNRSINAIGDSLLCFSFNEDTNTTLICFDTLAHFRWKKSFPIFFCDTSSSQNSVDLKRTKNGEWLMLTTIDCPYLTGGQFDIKLTKLDSNLNVIWTKQYGDYRYDDIPQRLKIDDSEYIIASTYDNGNLRDSGIFAQTQIFILDTAGNVIHRWRSNPNKLEIFVRDVIKTKDGGYVYSGMGNGYEQRTGTSFSYLRVKGLVAKINILGTTIWSDTFSVSYTQPGYPNASISTVFEKSDSSIICAGSIYGGFETLDSPLDNQFSTLIKLTPTGDVVWKRKYQYGLYLINYDYDVRSTSDGGYVFCGESKDYYYLYDSTLQQGWVLKVDSNGCMSLTDPQCHPTVVPDVPWANDIGIYPNPVATSLTIELPVALPRWQLDVVDMTGRILFTHTSHYMKEKIDVSNLPPGAYIYHITSEGQLIKAGKLGKY